MKPIWKILIVAGILLALVVGAVVTMPNRAKSDLEAYREQLKRGGEKMTPAELIPRFSAEETNNGRAFSTAGDMLGQNPINDPPVMRWISPGHALVSWAETNWPGFDTTNLWPDVIEAVKRRQETLGKLQKLLKETKIGYQCEFRDGIPVSLQYLSTFKRTAIWLSIAAAAAMHEEDSSDAWNNLEAESEIVSRVHMEPLLINQLVRDAVVQVELSQTWEALQYPGWSDAQLATLQENWSSFNLVDQLDATLSVERTSCGSEFQKMRGSYSNLVQSVFAAPTFLGTNYDAYEDFRGILSHPLDGIRAHIRYRKWKATYSYEEELCEVKLWQAALESVRCARTNDAFVQALATFETTATNLMKGFPDAEEWFVYADGLPDSIAHALLRTAEAETERCMLVTALALERYRLRLGNYPNQLSDLTPDILQKVPIDFMDGKPLRYRLKNDGSFLLYSVGEDGKDDGGDASPTQNSHYSWYKMRDAVWPTPATPDEVKKYKAEQLKEIKPKPRAAPSGTNSEPN